MNAGNITRRGTHSWRLKYEDGERDPQTGKRATRFVTVRGTKKDAQRELTRLLAEVDNGTSVDPSTVTVAAYIRGWMNGADHLAGKTRDRYRALAEQQVVPHLGGLILQKLRPVHVAGWHATILKSGGKDGAPLSARTVGHAHRLLHTVLARAASLEIVSRNVAGMVRPPKVEAEEVEILTAAEVGVVLSKLAGHRLFPIAVLALGTGLRRGEMCELRWGDIDMDSGVLRVERAVEQTRAGLKVKAPKTRHGRRAIALPGSVIDALRAHWLEQLKTRFALGLGRPSADDLALTLPDGSRWGPDYLSRVWRLAMIALGLPRVGLHSLRHAHASALISAGVDVLTISRRLGHATPGFTLAVYGHLFANTDAAAAKAIDVVLGAKSPN